MKSSSLILITAILFIVSSVTIAAIVNRELDPNYKKDWFAIGFVSPNEDTSDFILANHSPDTAFRYTIQSKGVTLSEETFQAGTGETVTIHPDNTNLPKPYTISVFPENNPKKSESLTRK